MTSQQKKWLVMPEISEEIIKKNPDIKRIVLQLLYNRGLKEREEIDLFLEPDYASHTNSPLLFANMAKAVDLVVRNIKEKNKIIIYGDYDADGVTSSAVLYDILSIFKASADVYIPDRVSEGYGLNKEAIDDFVKNNVKLIITVDGGIRNKDEVNYALKNKIDVIITDHHVPPEDKANLPDCLIINPLVKGEKYPFKYLSGVGVAFKLAKALILKSKLSEGDKQKLEDRILDLVAIGTIADCVSLLGENRVLVKKGMEIINNTKRVGLKELIKEANISSAKLDSWNIGFQIGPRLNAAGRMDHANTALELLITKNKDEAKTIARHLNNKNIERQEVTEEIVEEVYAQVELKSSKDKIIFAVSGNKDAWNEGVIGLVAGRISDKFYLPSLIITKTEDGYKGSGRSIKEFNIIEAVEECKELLNRYGGHPAACGFSLEENNLEKFRDKITAIANRKLKDAGLQPQIKIEAEVGLEEINEDFLGLIDEFSPFGQNNERPKFLSRAVQVVDVVNMGMEGQHIKLKLKKNNSRIINAIGFSQAEKWKDLKIGDIIDIVYYPEINEFNGRREAQIKIIDIKNCNA